MRKNHNYKGIFITFEGPEGSGKSTQSNMLYEYLKNRNHDVITTFEPGGTPIANQIRSVILSRENIKMTPECEMFLYAASRSQHVREIIVPKIESGGIVICDRFTDSSIAYQGFGRELGYDRVSEIQKIATGGVMPDLTIMLDIETEIGLERTFNKRNPNKIESSADRIELENITFHKKVRDGYLKLASMFPERIKVLNANEDPKAIFEKIKTLITAELGI
ncbi:MAG: dTMP kinase [Candidatus Wallbacteria bacterium]